MSVRSKWIFAALASAVLVACVTINVYFPEAAAERAADRFIQDVIGREAADAGGNGEPGAGGMASRFAPLLALSPIASAHAQQPDIDIDSAQIRAIRDRMSGRHRDHLADWFDAGAIGFTRDGLVGVRDRSAVPLSERRNLEQVVNAENADRNAVYREIAVANGHPEWEPEIRETFARRWIGNARSGWYYQNEQGQWVQK